MHQRISAFTLLSCLVLVAPVWAETVVTTSALNLRQEPSTASPRILLLPSGAKLEVLDRSEVWMRVRYGENVGWVHSDFVVDPELSAEVSEKGDPQLSARDARLARDVALLRVAQLEKELESLRSARPAAAQPDGLQADVERLTRELEERDLRIRELGRPVGGSEELALGAGFGRVDPDELQTTLALRQGRIGELEEALNRQSVAATELVAMRERLAAAEARESSLIASLAERDRALEATLEETTDWKRRATQAEAGSSRMRGELANLAEVQALVVQGEDRIGELEEALIRQTEVSESRAVEVGEWQRRAMQATAEVSDLRDEFARVSGEIEALRSARATSEPADPRRLVAPAEPLDLAAEAPADEGRGVVVAEPIAPARPATEDQAAPSATVAPRSIADEVLAAVQTWAEAWSSQDPTAYLSMYSAQFRPPSGMDREAWESQRRARVIRPSFIEVAVSNADVRPLARNRVVVAFDQAYRSDSFSDRVRKTLELVQIDGAWEIVREDSN